jgi:hypothetical protein
MIDDGPSELPAKPAHTAGRHREGRGNPIDRRGPAPRGDAHMGACLARPDRTIKSPTGRRPGYVWEEDGAR